MLKLACTAFIVLFLFTANAQKRIAVDLSSRLKNIGVTVSYHQVIKGGLLFSGGISAGSTGEVKTFNDTMRLYTGNPINSGFNNVNQIITDTSTSYSLLNYRNKGRSIALAVGLGYFYEFGIIHGIRANLYAKFGYAKNTMEAFYRSTETYTSNYRAFDNYHFTSSISFELFHTIRDTGRSTFYYGFKIPYFYAVAPKFTPEDPKNVYYGFT